MTSKEQVHQILDELPDDCSLQDVQYRLYVVEMLQRRLRLADQGSFVDHTQVEKRFEPWLAQWNLSQKWVSRGLQSAAR
ncbi:MAG: hypothetical protein FLDDKLPJ_00795 [Phycisphaerae bacterium]|nr:hypothetical protein [Phycisphaerae bacterium]